MIKLTEVKRNAVKTEMISIRLTHKAKRWLKKHKINQTNLFMSALKQLGYTEK